MDYSSQNHNVIVRGDILGAEKLKIGELAEITHVTKRTIDYYTNLGLLKAERSSSNYRYYDFSSIERIRLIEQRKAEGMSLEQIKHEVIERFAEEIDVLELRLKMKGLEKEVSAVLAQLDKADQNRFDEIKKKISPESLSLIQTLLLFLS
ncbi:MerR family transcriptional regulator [Robertmurraya kyonggiensis]|uniref:MerR family transcriptional regulator n=1 Tax=Robertmurraya kyonggiensis TaxID=1037680 RepID=A0A4U1CXX1_9BACI|nr:MerR family transcriptional regulator [Robertmurraya kyonggiensis]TKC14915.1 MerR family transcriptional regulator [Robertmurraya kyonggiensis]